MSGSVPTSNVTDSEYCPAFELVDDMYIMSSTPLIAVSSGPPTTSAITSALAPG